MFKGDIHQSQEVPEEPASQRQDTLDDILMVYKQQTQTSNKKWSNTLETNHNAIQTVSTHNLAVQNEIADTPSNNNDVQTSC